MPAQTRRAGLDEPQIEAQIQRTYRSKGQPPQQKRLHNRRRQVKTYGHDRPSRLEYQTTLTQMNFAAPFPEEFTGLASEDEDEESIEDVPEPMAQVNRKGPAKKSTTSGLRTNRRRTLGDEDEASHDGTHNIRKRRRTMGDTPTASASFQTQTLTQMLSTDVSEYQGGELIDESTFSAEDLHLVKETPRRRKQPERGSAPATTPNATLGRSRIVTTPVHRLVRTEIPSSQCSVSPILMRHSPRDQASPLGKKSSNIPTPNSVSYRVRKSPNPKVVIQDTYSASEYSPIASSPKPNVGHQKTPTKKIRFDLPEDKENITPGRRKPKSPRAISARTSARRPLEEKEIPDSDDESDDDCSDHDLSTKLTPEEVATIPVLPASRAADDSGGGDPDDNLREGSLDGPKGSKSDSSIQIPPAAEEITRGILIPPAGGQIPNLDARNCLFGAPHSEMKFGLQQSKTVDPTPEDKSGQVNGPVEQIAIPTTDIRVLDTDTSAVPEGACTQYTVQSLESQRVPLEAIRATGLVSEMSDIIISIYCDHVQKMVERTKTHEFRPWRVPESVSRVWIYTTKPASELRYMCILGPAQLPGEIGSNGIGNASFNAKGKSTARLAYEILQMYELNNPVPLKRMRENGWPAVPHRYAFVPPAVVGQLTSNLRCALWGEESEPCIVHSSPVVRGSQELEASLHRGANRAGGSGPWDLSSVVLSSQSPPSSTSKANVSPDGIAFAKPALPGTFSESSGSLRAPVGQRTRRRAHLSQATTISQISSSSPIISPEKSALGAVPDQDSRRSSPTLPRQSRHIQRTSSLLSRSQMLPDSLLQVDIEEPPAIIWGSADEDSE